MRDPAVFLLLALTAAAFVPAAAAFAVDATDGTMAAGAGTTVVAAPDDAAIVPVVPADAAASVPDAVTDLPANVAAVAETAAAVEVPLDGVAVDVPLTVGVDAGVSASVLPDGPAIVVAVGAPEPSSVHVAPASDGAFLSPAVAAPAAAVAVGLAVGGFGLRALLALLPAGLFSRIERGQVLDNPVRARVHEAVAQDPGLTISEVQSRAGIAWGTAIHHLHRLEAHGLLVSVSHHPTRRYFVANTPAAAQRAAIAAILQPTARRIASLVVAQPGIDQTGLCQALGLNGPAASKHLGQFRGHGLVLSQRVGRRTVHHPTDGLRSALRTLAGSVTIRSGQEQDMSAPLAGLSPTCT